MALIGYRILPLLVYFNHCADALHSDEYQPKMDLMYHYISNWYQKETV